eukprot:SAG11_NODE_1639_length_4533_cov_5.684484_2_plen_71_part_00
MPLALGSEEACAKLEAELCAISLREGRQAWVAAAEFEGFLRELRRDIFGAALVQKHEAFAAAPIGASSGR